MKNLVFLALLIGGGFFFFKRCAVSTSKSVAFTGTWIHVVENGIAGTEESSQLEVVTDGTNQPQF